MKLFVIKIVANNFFGLDRNSKTKSPFGVFDFDSSSNVVLDNEKKATSVPEIIADITKRQTKISTSKIMYQGKEVSIEYMGSGSKVIR
jgi:hypothetical protein